MILDRQSEALAQAYLDYVQPVNFSPPEGRLAGLLNDAAHVGLLSSDALVYEPLCNEVARGDLLPGTTEYRLRLSPNARACVLVLADRMGVSRDRVEEICAAAVRVGLQRLQPPRVQP